MGKFSFDSVVFDLDGVITRTAKVHAKAWKAEFDEYLHKREKEHGEAFREFTYENDYLGYVDGKPRYEGVRSFLESRNINIPFGEPSDSPEKETICGLGNRKNQLFNEFLRKDGAEVFESSVEIIKRLRKEGVRVGVASSSKNCQQILQSVGLEELFETRVDGVVSAKLGLTGKPEGDIFVTAARNLDTLPANSIVVEDATSGVQAGRNGGFGLVLGVAREDNVLDLLENGADVAVKDMSEISLEWMEEWFKRKADPFFDSWDGKDRQPRPEPSSLGSSVNLNPSCTISSKGSLFAKKRLVFFLDYDGTLTPIVDRPEDAVISKEMQATVIELSKIHTVAIVSGRMREDVEKLAGIKDLIYAGSHGFDINAKGSSIIQPAAKETIPVVTEVIGLLGKELGGIEGVLIEKKKFSVAVHYRLADEKHLPHIEKYVRDIIAKYKSLRLLCGKMVFELLPNFDWDKGQAIRWIMKALKISWENDAVIYIGDDTTDEFAFRMVRTRGTGILVSEEDRPTTAEFRLNTPEDVRRLFEEIIKQAKK